jgi:hypothetical protein
MRRHLKKKPIKKNQEEFFFRPADRGVSLGDLIRAREGCLEAMRPAKRELSATKGGGGAWQVDQWWCEYIKPIAYRWRRIKDRRSTGENPIVRHNIAREKRMIAKLTLLGLFLLSFGTSCVGHDGHDEEQMPLDYVRYPYQAAYVAYPGDNSGKSVLSCPRFIREMDLPFSHRGCDILWNNDLREAAMGSMPYQREGRPSLTSRSSARPSYVVNAFPRLG